MRPFGVTTEDELQGAVNLHFFALGTVVLFAMLVSAIPLHNFKRARAD
jgi:hypothetical protein